MGGSTSREVKDSDPPELSEKSKAAKCAAFVGALILDQDIDGGTAYEVRTLMRDDEAGLAEVLQE